MLETRSKDGKILFCISYSYQLHRYNVNKYRDGHYMASVGHHELSFITDWVKKSLEEYNKVNPPNGRYQKLLTGDIYDNVTETIINHTALIGLLDGLETGDKTTIQEAIAELRQ